LGYDADMKNIREQCRTWYAKVEERSLAKLPHEARADVIAFDAKWKVYWPRYIAGLVIIWVAAASVLRFAADNLSWTESFVMTLILLVFVIAAFLSAWFGYYKFKFTFKMLVMMFSLTIIGAIAGSMVGSLIKAGTVNFVEEFTRIAPKVIVAGSITGVIYCAFLVLIVLARRKQLQLRNAELEREAIEANLARQLADARLRLMQAQVEPHFLFNTLASVQHLAEPHSPDAANLTRELITFLRAGLGGLRDETTTLKREFEMAAAYLAIMQTRMGKRLTFTLDLPADIVNVAVPPAMLISLVENAIKHGVEPATDGGSIHVFAKKDNHMIQFGVRDTGLGMTNMLAANAADGGLGLANVRERLQAIFGDDAQLTIEESQPRGVSAVINMKQATIK
jgi:sensor histidine kinase YesM